jgi:glucose-6-phosphate-specific signal transduction histidine kinase
MSLLALRFPYSYTVGIHIATYYAYPNFQDKIIKPPLNVSTKFIVSTTLLFSIDVGGDPIMVDDATMFSNSLIVLI